MCLTVFVLELRKNKQFVCDVWIIIVDSKGKSFGLNFLHAR